MDDEWTNYLGEQQFLPEKKCVPKTEDEVAQIVRDAASAGQRVHFAGAGHASSPLVPCDGWLIASDALEGVTREKGNFVRVMAGTRIAALNAALDAMGLAMPNLGSAVVQSIAGAIATGTHGSGAKYGAIADSVRSVDIVCGAGNRMRVEPASAPYSDGDAMPEGVALRQDDDLFHTVVVGVGVAGLVTSLVLEMRPAFLLSETRTLTTWEALSSRAAIDDEILAADHYEIWLNPYETHGAHAALVTVRTEADAKTPLRPRIEPWELKYKFIRQVLTLGLDACPRIVPDALDWAMTSQATKNGPWVDKSFGIFDLGDVNKMPALATEWFFPFAKWRDAVETLLHEARALSLKPRAVGGVPFGVRFVKASPHFLAMNHGAEGEVFCTIELPVYDGDHDRNTLLRGYERAAEKHGGRPHWGQAHHPRPLKLGERYPHIEKWKVQRHAIDPKETFANAASHAEGLTPTRVLGPVVAHQIETFDDTKPRVVLPIDPSREVHVDRRRFEVHANATRFANAFQDALLQPGALVAHKFEVLRAPSRSTGGRFVVGERFQGRFALEKQLLQDASPHPACWTKILRGLDVDRLFEKVENVLASNYGEVRELDVPRRIRYVYLTETPFAGESLFTVEPIDATHCRYTEQLTFQPTSEITAAAMALIGLKLHNQVVFGQVEAACDLLGVHHTPLDPLHTGKPNVR